MLSRLLSKIWLQHKLLQGYRGKSGGKLHKTMRGGGSRAETTCGRGGEMLSAGGRNRAGKKPPFRPCPQKGTCVFGHQTDKPATSCHWLRLLPVTSECLELPRVLPNAYSDPRAQRFSSVVPTLLHCVCPPSTEMCKEVEEARMHHGTTCAQVPSRLVPMPVS